MALLRYSVLRLALLVVIAVVLYQVGMRSIQLVVVAALLALMVSYILLGGPRESAAVEIAERRARRAAGGERFSRGIEDDAAAEDARIDGAAAGPSPLPADLEKPTHATPQKPVATTSDGEPERE
ncbi:DUF4229 domain-containing protein [Sanguibacter antarcticus]|uniref:Uncharacterized protein DUF4229 n=1 Tax=Sanguibacter antarcticus TaxID=372484 RepID=A0A2A9E5K2_9MICO|nr:DUF4229 domain-containing protein [Sanguibacter antarcticus]PFG34134.1 uncharacterized protein DUF4229 [Sanguibacter antarcticus]